MKKLTSSEAKKQLKNLRNWSLIKNYLEKDFDFEDFKQALNFVNKVAAVAERMDHHPDLYLSYGKVKISIYTHSMRGLSEKDFIFAQNIDKLK